MTDFFGTSRRKVKANSLYTSKGVTSESNKQWMFYENQFKIFFDIKNEAISMDLFDTMGNSVRTGRVVL